MGILSKMFSEMLIRISGLVRLMTQFDVIAFSTSFELDYINLLKILKRRQFIILND